MADKILVSGLINVEITLRIDGFPIPYTPVRYPFFGVNSTVSGVGYNISKALTTLGTPVNFLSIIGQDPAGTLITEALEQDGIDGRYVAAALRETPHSVILYDPNGRRQINVDLKDIQERNYAPELYNAAADECDLVVLCNINFSRPFLHWAKEKCIVTDVHTIDSLEDNYNHDFMAHADILFMSDEHLPCSPAAWAERVLDRHDPEIIVIGLGERGAHLLVKRDGFSERIPAVQTRDIVNTIGAGDALFSAFIHFYNKTGDPYISLKKAITFASWKIGERGAAEGFLTETELEHLYDKVQNQLI